MLMCVTALIDPTT